MSTSSARLVPRIIRNDLTKRLTEMGYQQSPHDVLSRFPASSHLTVKQSIASNRFFMYEEHLPAKIQDDDPMTPTTTKTPMELADLLGSSKDHHYYWTSPISSVAPTLLQEEFDWYQQLHYDENDNHLDPSIQLDPRGPSLWMGTSGSGTQCHYDVANNVILQLFGTKRIRCFAPHAGVTHLHVFPDAHPRARKSQVNLDVLVDDLQQQGLNEAENNAVAKQYPHFFQNDAPPQPFLDITLKPGDALEIPAFWFHHVENSRHSNEPSVSLNSFAMSEPMMIAQQIFQKASQPVMRYYTQNGTREQVPGILRALGVTLVQRLGLVDDDDEEAAAIAFIGRNLMEARYSPRLVPEEVQNKVRIGEVDRVPVTEKERQMVEACVNNIHSDFQDLVMEVIEGNEVLVDRNGIVLLVALHLLELWAVQMVGAASVYDAWKKALE